MYDRRKHGASMVQAWRKRGAKMAHIKKNWRFGRKSCIRSTQAWYKHGAGLAQAWRKHGASVAQAWRKRGAKVAQKWLKSRKIDLDGRIENQTGNVQAWRERGASVAQTRMYGSW